MKVYCKRLYYGTLAANYDVKPTGTNQLKTHFIHALDLNQDLNFYLQWHILLSFDLNAMTFVIKLA